MLHLFAALILLAGSFYAVFQRRGLPFDLNVAITIAQYAIPAAIAGAIGGFVGSAILAGINTVHILRSVIVGAMLGVTGVATYIAWQTEIQIYPLIMPPGMDWILAAVMGFTSLAITALLNRLPPGLPTAKSDSK